MDNHEITTLCSLYASTQSNKDEKFKDAVSCALDICKHVSPNTRFRLIETPTKNFMLVTNVLPAETNVKSHSQIKLNIGEAVNQLSQAFKPKKIEKKNHMYTLQNFAKMQKSGIVASSYIIYTKKHLQIALAIDKSDFVSDILRFANTPGLLTHNNIADIETSLWMLFCGSRSFCVSDTCFGHSKEHFRNPFPVLLPPIFYETVSDFPTYIGLIEFYVYGWYKDCNIDTEFSKMPPIALERIKLLMNDLHQKFNGANFPVLSHISNTCLFCTLYYQNRLAIDFANEKIKSTSFNPIIIKDCSFLHMNIYSGHILPGKKSASFIPVYDIAKILSLTDFNSGKVEFRF